MDREAWQATVHGVRHDLVTKPRITTHHHPVAQACPTPCDPIDRSTPESFPMGFPRKEYWSGLSFLPPGNLPDPRILPVSPSSPAFRR